MNEMSCYSAGSARNVWSVSDEIYFCCVTFWKSKSDLEKILILSFAAAAFLSVLFIILYFTKGSYSIKQEEICTSEFCLKAAVDLLKFVDFTQDPCENFYQYVCGNYRKNPQQEKLSTPIASSESKKEKDLASIMENPIEETDSESNILIKKFYRECINETKIDGDENRAFKKAISSLGGWPLLEGPDWNESNFDLTQFYVKAKKLGLSVYSFFSFKSHATTGNSSTLQISGPRGRSVKLDEVEYNATMTQIVQILGRKSFVGDENLAVIEFANKLKKVELPMKVNQKVETLKELIGNCSYIPWLEILTSTAGNNNFTESSSVSFGDIESYCVSLKKLIESTEKRTMANYLIWSIIDQTYDYLSGDVRRLYAAMKNDDMPRLLMCSLETDRRFKYVRETIFIRDRTPKIVKEKMSEIIELLQGVFLERIHTCDWMDDSTKKTAIERMKSIEPIIGGDAKLDDVKSFDKLLGIDGFDFTSDNIFEMVQQKKIRETEFFFQKLYDPKNSRWPKFIDEVIVTNAIFLQAVNILILPAPVFGSIFFDHRLPAFMNYGSIGKVIGHEIMHSLEKSGRDILDNFGVKKDWWTNYTADAYDKTVQCVVDDYESSPFKYELDGNQTLDENVADFVGVDVAYEAYMAYVRKHGPEKKLPLDITIEQVFWVQTGTFMCSRTYGNETEYEVFDEEHATPKYRIRAAPRNSKYFAKDFNCPQNSYMNPEHKCRVL